MTHRKYCYFSKSFQAKLLICKVNRSIFVGRSCTSTVQIRLNRTLISLISYLYNIQPPFNRQALGVLAIHLFSYKSSQNINTDLWGLRLNFWYREKIYSLIDLICSEAPFNCKCRNSKIFDSKYNLPIISSCLQEN